MRAKNCSCREAGLEHWIFWRRPHTHRPGRRDRNNKMGRTSRITHTHTHAHACVAIWYMTKSTRPIVSGSSIPRPQSLHRGVGAEGGCLRLATLGYIVQVAQQQRALPCVCLSAFEVFDAPQGQFPSAHAPAWSGLHDIWEESL